MINGGAQSSSSSSNANNNHELNMEHLAATSGGPSLGSRANHALWDQLGLLHWIKRNVGFFGGNARNLNLVALDNQASLCVQLLTMSPLSKGGFGQTNIAKNLSSIYLDNN